MAGFPLYARLLTLMGVIGIASVYMFAGPKASEPEEMTIKAGGPEKYQHPPGSVRDMFVEVDEGHKMHAVKGGSLGSGNLSFILLHGADRNMQNAQYWQPHFEFLSSMGQFYALDLFGHGSSEGSATAVDNAAAVKQLIKDEEIEGNIVFVARSAGGRTLVETLKCPETASKTSKIVLIAPGGISQDTVPDQAKDIPVLLMWANEDPVNSPANKDTVAAAFNTVGRFTFETLSTHLPEQQAPEEFQANVRAFVEN